MKKYLILKFLFFLFILFFFNLLGYSQGRIKVAGEEWILLNTGPKEEKLFYSSGSIKKLSKDKIKLNILYYPSSEIVKRCKNYWIQWLCSGEYREVLWEGLPEEDNKKCEALKYGIYEYEIDCAKRKYKEKNWAWYNKEDKILYSRKSVGISFLSIPEDLIKDKIFERVCKD